MGVCCCLLYVFCVSRGGFRLFMFFFFQAEDGIRDLVRSRGLGDVYKRQRMFRQKDQQLELLIGKGLWHSIERYSLGGALNQHCLLYTSDAADERSSVDLGGRRIIKKKNKRRDAGVRGNNTKNRTQ